ncbi:hypothetical protein WME73_37430 [Sorangium sp. So ce302]|uniref:hypothetical protein n=1 Tax=unclassified Sorangium TaxID=2621164 RepID=UPI003F5FF890
MTQGVPGKRKRDPVVSFESTDRASAAFPSKEVRLVSQPCVRTAPVVVTVTVQPTPVVLTRDQGAAPVQVLQAVGAPAGGTYTWTLPNAAGVVQFQGGAAPINSPNATIVGLTGGVEAVRVTYAFAGQTPHADAQVAVVAVQLLPLTPTMAHAVPAPTMALQAAGAPGGGTYAWDLPDATNVVQFPGGVAPGNNAAATIEGAAPGTERVRVRYTVGAHTAMAIVRASVVAVQIAPAPAPIVRPQGYPRHRVVLTAAFAPPGGTFLWTLGGANVLAIDPNQPGNHGVGFDRIRLIADDDGTEQVTVRYTVNGVHATAVTNVEVRREACSRVDLAPAGGAYVTPVAAAACLHGPAVGARQRPHAPGGVATVAPTANHHHGGLCAGCQVNGRNVEHWLDPDLAQNDAVLDVIALRNQIHALRAVAAPLRAASPLNFAWLANVPVDSLNPAGGLGTAGKMIGVLRATRMNGTQVRLRAVSGNFAGLGAPPNGYWSRHSNNRYRIFSASRGFRDYAPAAVGPTFGRCAASALLAHALDFGLRVTSMAEIWVGPTAHGRQDGQLQASCPSCRRYLGHLLCTQGGQQRGAPFNTNSVLPPNQGF